MIRIGSFGRRHVSPEFWTLTTAGRMAVIAHEAGHAYHKHVRLQWLALFWPREDLIALRHMHEYEADAFAASVGYARELAAVLSLQPHGATATHPATRTRIARLLQAAEL